MRKLNDPRKSRNRWPGKMLFAAFAMIKTSISWEKYYGRWWKIKKFLQQFETINLFTVGSKNYNIARIICCCCAAPGSCTFLQHVWDAGHKFARNLCKFLSTLQHYRQTTTEKQKRQRTNALELFWHCSQFSLFPAFVLLVFSLLHGRPVSELCSLDLADAPSRALPNGGSCR